MLLKRRSGARGRAWKTPSAAPTTRCAAREAKELVAAEAVELSKSHMAQAEKLFKAGVVAKNDVLRSKVAVASAELDLIRAQNGSAVALTALRRAVGTDLPDGLAETRPLDKIFPTAKEMTPLVLSGDAVQAASAEREELKVYALLSGQAEKLARAAQGQLLPQILGAVGYVAADDKFFPSEHSEPVAAVGLYWNFYDSGEMHAKTTEAKAKAKELLFMLDDMKNAIRMEVTQAELNLKSAESRLVVATRQSNEAREELPDCRTPLRRERRHQPRHPRRAPRADKQPHGAGHRDARHQIRRGRPTLRDRRIKRDIR